MITNILTKLVKEQYIAKNIVKMKEEIELFEEKKMVIERLTKQINEELSNIYINAEDEIDLSKEYIIQHALSSMNMMINEIHKLKMNKEAIFDYNNIKCNISYSNYIILEVHFFIKNIIFPNDIKIRCEYIPYKLPSKKVKLSNDLLSKLKQDNIIDKWCRYDQEKEINLLIDYITIYVSDADSDSDSDSDSDYF
jgi:hypothetical protein